MKQTYMILELKGERNCVAKLTNCNTTIIGFQSLFENSLFEMSLFANSLFENSIFENSLFENSLFENSLLETEAALSVA